MHLRMKIISIGLLLLAGQSVFASGYEIPITLGGRAAGLAGIAASYTGGAEALYFNPAGLAREKQAQDITLFGTPLISQFKQPTKDGDSNFSMPFGIMYGITPTPDWGFGIGFYTSGGAKASYKNMSAGATTNDSLEEKTNMAIAEVALGAAYRVNDMLKLGVAYRVGMAKAEFSTLSNGANNGAAIADVTVSDLEDTQANAFKLGAQYRLNDKNQFGLTYRSPIFFEAKGKYGGRVYAGNTAQASVNNNSVTAKTVFPEQIALAWSGETFDKWTLHGEYSWTQYSRVQSIGLDGEFMTTPSAPGAKPVLHKEVIQNWKDQHMVRVAAEYAGYSMPIRFGYAWTSQVTDDNYARGTFAPPAPLHTFALGTGAWLADGLKLDGGFNYTLGDGKGNKNASNAKDTSYLRTGNFTVTEYALNLQLAYVF